MSDEILNFGTEFDTTVPPAGDVATMGDVIDESAGLAMPAAADVPTPDANSLAQPDATPAPQPGAVTDTGVDASERPPAQPSLSPQPAAPVTDLSTTSQGTSRGIIDSAAQMAKDNPGAAGIIGKMLAGGATGAMTALAMKNKMQAEREAEERRRQDVIRRGQVQALPAGTFTAKPAGIIDAARGT